MRRVVVSSIGALAACGRLDFRALDDAPRDLDAETNIDAFVLTPFGAPTPLTALNSTDNDMDPALAGDGLELVLASRRAGSIGNHDLWSTTRTDASAPWGPVTRLAALSSTGQDSAAELSADSSTVMFTSDRAGTLDIYAATRADRAAPWSTPAIVMELSNGTEDWNPFVMPDGLAVYWNSLRAGGQSYDIWVARRATAADAWGAPSRVVELCSAAGEGDMWIDPTERVIVFDSTRDGSYDLFVATRARATDPWSAPIPIAELNTTANERDPTLSADMRTIMFSRDGSPTGIDLYIATR
jgi:Tol biopolymer transport system component